MSITATELKKNLGKYLALSSKEEIGRASCRERVCTEDIYITRNGTVVAKLSNPFQDRVDMAKSLFGILPPDVTVEQAREERLDQI